MLHGPPPDGNSRPGDRNIRLKPAPVNLSQSTVAFPEGRHIDRRARIGASLSGLCRPWAGEGPGEMGEGEMMQDVTALTAVGPAISRAVAGRREACRRA